MVNSFTERNMQLKEFTSATSLNKLKKVNGILKEIYGYNIDYKSLTNEKAVRMVLKINEKIDNLNENDAQRYRLIKDCLTYWMEANTERLMESLDDETVDSAKVVIAAQEISDALQKMIENVAKMQVQDLLPIVDAMKDELGPGESRQFSDTATQILGDLVNSLKSTRESFDDALRAAQGNPADDMAMGIGDEGLGGDMIDDIEGDGVLKADADYMKTDEFGGEDSAIGADTGRELKPEEDPTIA